VDRACIALSNFVCHHLSLVFLETAHSDIQVQLLAHFNLVLSNTVRRPARVSQNATRFPCPIIPFDQRPNPPHVKCHPHVLSSVLNGAFPGGCEPGLMESSPLKLAIALVEQPFLPVGVKYTILQRALPLVLHPLHLVVGTKNGVAVVVVVVVNLVGVVIRIVEI